MCVVRLCVGPRAGSVRVLCSPSISSRAPPALWSGSCPRRCASRRSVVALVVCFASSRVECVPAVSSPSLVTVLWVCVVTLCLRVVEASAVSMLAPLRCVARFGSSRRCRRPFFPSGFAQARVLYRCCARAVRSPGSALALGRVGSVGTVVLSFCFGQPLILFLIPSSAVARFAPVLAGFGSRRSSWEHACARVLHLCWSVSAYPLLSPLALGPCSLWHRVRVACAGLTLRCPGRTVSGAFFDASCRCLCAASRWRIALLSDHVVVETVAVLELPVTRSRWIPCWQRSPDSFVVWPAGASIRALATVVARLSVISVVVARRPPTTFAHPGRAASSGGRRPAAPPGHHRTRWGQGVSTGAKGDR